MRAMRRETLRRLVRGELCASCHDRESEVRRGRNAKGGPPRKAAARLHRATVLVDRNGDAVLVEMKLCTGRAEAERTIARRWKNARVADYQPHART